ncbi:MAG: serine hydrolase domain-containing protein [Polyangiales bacterium]
MRTALLIALLGRLGCEPTFAPSDASVSDAGVSPMAVDGGPDGGRDAGTDAGPPEGLDDFVSYQMVAGGIPGVAAAVVRDGELAWVGTYGYADVEAERPVAADTLFIVASISKTVVAALALQLAEDGRLDLDAPLDDVLPYPVRHPENGEVPLTARMFFTHTSGLVDNWPALGRVTTEGRDAPMTLAEFAPAYVTPEGSLYASSNFGPSPGTRREYCNAGFGVLGHLLEVAGDGPLEALTEARLFTPLRMDGASWFLRDTDLSRLATPYSWSRRDGFLPNPHYGFAHYPATSLRVSVTGLSRFAIAMLTGEVDGVRVLSDQSVAELGRVQFPRVSGSQAFAWSWRTVGSRRWLAHSGSTYGASALLLIQPEERLAIVLLTNADAYLRSEFGFEDGANAISAIADRLDAEAATLSN